MSLGSNRILLLPSSGHNSGNTDNEDDFYESYYEFDEERVTKGGKRQRVENWSYEEKELLVECVSRHPVVEDRFNETDVNLRKHKSWKIIADEIANRGLNKNSSYRTPQRVREQWQRLKAKAKDALKKYHHKNPQGGSSQPYNPYKKGPTPLDYRIKEIFPHLFNARADEFDKHSTNSGHYHSSSDTSVPHVNSIPVGDLPVPQNMHVQHQANNQYSGLQANDITCSPDFNSSPENVFFQQQGGVGAGPGLHGGASSGPPPPPHSNPAPLPPTTSGPPTLRPKRERAEPPLPLTAKERKERKKASKAEKGSKSKHMVVKRKIPVRMNAFEHLLLQANLKKINTSMKQSDELHRLKLTIQRKESYLLDLQIKRLELDVEERLRKAGIDPSEHHKETAFKSMDTDE